MSMNHTTKAGEVHTFLVRTAKDLPKIAEASLFKFNSTCLGKWLASVFPGYIRPTRVLTTINFGNLHFQHRYKIKLPIAPLVLPLH